MDTVLTSIFFVISCVLGSFFPVFFLLARIRQLEMSDKARDRDYELYKRDITESLTDYDHRLRDLDLPAYNDVNRALAIAVGNIERLSGRMDSLAESLQATNNKLTSRERREKNEAKKNAKFENEEDSEGSESELMQHEQLNLFNAAPARIPSNAANVPARRWGTMPIFKTGT